MKFIELKQRLLVAALQEAKIKGYSSYLDPKDIANLYKLPYEPGQIRLCTNDFSDNGLISLSAISGEGEDGGLNFTFTGYGLETAEELLENQPEYGLAVSLETKNLQSPDDSESPSVALKGSEGEPFVLGHSKLGAAPASDRIVTLDHNSKTYEKAMASLDKVIAEVAAERSNDFEEKDRIQGELEAGKKLMERLEVDPVKVRQVLGDALKWLAKRFVSVPIGEWAAKTWEFIKDLI